MRIGLRVDQLDIYPHLASRFLHATFKNVCYAKLPCDLGEIARFAVVSLRGRARNYFQVCDLCQSRQDLLLDAFSEIGVVRIFA